MTTDLQMGDILLNGKPYRIDLTTYRVTDVVDFAPRAASPGGSIIHSELGLYQPLLQTDWRHGFGFPWYQDASGFMRADGNIDTRQPGIAMLYSQAHSSDSDNAIKYGGIIFNAQLYTWGVSGLRTFNGSVWSGITSARTGTITKNNGNVALVGVGTLFLTELAVGDTITIPGGGGTDTLVVATITNDLNLTVSVAPTHTSATQVVTLAMTNPINFLVATGQYLFICQDGGRIKKMTTAGVVTNAGLDANATDYKWGLIFGGYFYFGKDGTTRVHFSDQEDLNDLEGTTADPDTIYIGAGGYATLGSMAYAGKMYVYRPDGIWLLDNKIATPVLSYADQTSALNFRSMAEYNGLLTYPVRDRIKQWNGARVTDQTPPQWSDLFPYGTYGRFKNFVRVGDFFYCTARTNESSYSEDLLSWDGTGWHKLMRIISAAGAGEVTAMFYDVQNNRLWYHYDHPSADHTDYIQFQDQSDYPYSDFPVTGTHSLVSSRLDMGFRRVKKSLRSLLVEASSINLVGTSQYLNIYYSLDGAAWVLWAASPTIAASGVTILDTPNGLNSVEFYYMQLRVDFVTTNASLSPVLEGLTLRFIMRPNVAYGQAFTVLLADELVYGTHQDPRTMMDLRTDLRTCRASAAPLAYTDPHGIDHFVYVSSLVENLSEEDVGQNADGSRSFQGTAHLNVVEV